MKIIGFSQLHNELSNGNLFNWMKCMQEVCDYIYIYDNASTDGSVEYYSKFENVRTILSDVNRHSIEGCSDLFGKKALLEKLIHEQPDTDWIFWMDGDTMLDGRLSRELFCEMLMMGDGFGAELICLGHYNLWRSDVYYRTDSLFHNLHIHGVNALWKNNGFLSFNDEGGLHQKQWPDGMRPFHGEPHQTILKEAWRGRVNGFEPSLIHRGFATDSQIVNKYHFYKVGQEGEELERLIREDGLTVERLPAEVLPSWFEIVDQTNPKHKRRIIEDVFI